ncbi:uncharacterized protein LOC122317333 [Carya illinoinensis]|uniref:uncharacterized protein LOC122317333 n=1 Tax=Carya illinoinensis TaxID=32201 RepID=UPI001C71C925|nr:uncharacterized protein LOC122317333 [Carya illinoinensis]
MEDLEMQWDQFSLTEEENSVIEIGSVDLSEVTKKGELCVVCKLWSDRRVGKDIVRATMAKIWRVDRSFTFQEVSTNLFVITFVCKEDKNRVLEGRPWLFGNCLLVLKPLDGFIHPMKMNFDSECFWIQMHNLPFVCMKSEIGKKIGESIGRVQEVDVREGGSEWGGVLRVKVELNLKKAVARGRTMDVLGKKHLISLKYEKLPRLCFDCGMIVHGGKGCSNSNGNGSGKQYGT